MLHLIPTVLIAALAQGQPGQDLGPTAKRMERVRQFVKAFFSEDEKALLTLASGRLKSDLEAYFWIRRKIHGEKAVQPREWTGEVKILRSTRRKILQTEAVITEIDAEVFEITLDGKPFHCGFDDQNKVVLFADPPK